MEVRNGLATLQPTPPDATIVVAVNDPSQIGEARRAAAALSSQLNFNATRAGEMAIIVTELANNLVRHGGGGEMLMRPISPSGGRGGGSGAAIEPGAGIEVLSLDRGKGISRINEAMRDGYSTGGTAGNGLGAIRRLAATFDLASTPTRGTAVVARVWPADAPAASRFDIGVICVPVRGEVLCGDTWCVIERPGRCLAIVADGLGHGPIAAEASQLAIDTFRQHLDASPRRIVEQLHAALRPTRGAAVTVVEIDASAGKIRSCGVGNVASASIAPAGKSRSLLSHNGTVGAEARRILEVEQPWLAGSLLILTSDGITSRWNLADYPGLLTKHASLIAGILYRDHLRGRDDATVLVVKDALKTV